jgi:uncharacterized OB-fold protein
MNAPMPWDQPEYDDDPATEEGPQPCDLERGDEIAVVDCPECGRAMADDAEICPNCGCWVRSAEFRPARTIWAVAIALAALAGVVTWVLASR